jgi:predicted small secreted protein
MRLTHSQEGSVMSSGVKRVVLVSAALIAAGVLVIQMAGCHTFKGVGRDIEAMAQGGQDMIDGK